MGLLIAGLVLAPIVGAAAALDWRARRRRRTHPRDHRAVPRDASMPMDVGDLES